MILSLQYLRGIAALMVVYVHIGVQVPRVSGHALPLSELGAYGVDLFFVISGVVMWVTTIDGRTTPVSFMRKRILRIAPLYWSLTLFVSLVSLLMPSLVQSTSFDLSHLLASLFFVPWENPKFPGFYPVLIPGWTLNYEMMFYVIFAFALLLPSRWRLGMVLFILCGLTLVGATGSVNGVLSYYTNSIVLEFGAGVLVGALYTSNVGLSRGMASAAVAIGLVLFFGLVLSTNLPGVIAAGVPATLIVGSLVLRERAHPFSDLPLLKHIGDASYSIYLTHIITLPVITKLWMAMHLDAQGWNVFPFYLACMLGALIVGSATYLLVERRLNVIARLLWPEPKHRRAAIA
jgi:exopolysaccharide production protein ExoZ